MYINCKLNIWLDFWKTFERVFVQNKKITTQCIRFKEKLIDFQNISTEYIDK